MHCCDLNIPLPGVDLIWLLRLKTNRFAEALRCVALPDSAMAVCHRLHRRAASLHFFLFLKAQTSSVLVPDRPHVTLKWQLAIYLQRS